MMAGLAGVGALIRLGLRRDRVRIPVWALALGLTTFATVPALDAAYPTAESRAARAVLMNNPAAIMLAGPGYGLDDYTLGAMVANELSLTLIVTAAIMSVLMVVRHTRAEEESGRAELVRAAVVGRPAASVAAIAITAIANGVVALLVWLGLVGGGLAAGDGLLLGVSIGLTGLTFGAIALVAAQLTEHARAASGIGMAVLGAAFLVRGIGDIQVQHGGTLSWFSPIAWAQQTRPYADGRWWPLLLSIALTAAALLLARALGERRDFAAGLLPQRLGRPTARPALATPLAMAVRLAWPSFVAWTIGIVLGAVTFGSLVQSMQDAIADNPALTQVLGSSDDVSEAVFALFLPYIVLAAAAYGLTVVQRLRSEESEGRAEIVLARPVSRTAWLGSGLVVAMGGAALAMVVGGVFMGLAGAAATGDGAWTGRVTAATLGYLPALALIIGVGALLMGAWPRLMALAWALVAWMTVVMVVGTLVNMPDWARWISPIEQTPAAPQEPLTAAPLLVMGVGAAALTVIALVTFRRRDVPNV